ncbi:hypothetical protein N7532_001599 [Penicillium argentinense]|uniref:beta-N-acetylhexosaminidase n=1 Tax=Penicillium argentinense TaxID=1131581 RepID=A0A9W9G2T7_9EURO|nr:uncharacterized protein N7532_001599 [Penicillium argentinense]KAJ5111064.1 hypothetical protein N7532_001599 [Penicillium argentinense]
MRLSRTFFCAANALTWVGAHADLLTVPTTPFTETGGEYALSDITGIVVDSRYADDVNTNGQTLIPPTLSEFAHTFQEDLRSVLMLELPIGMDDTRQANTIFITLGNNTGFKDAAGTYNYEGYSLEVDGTGIVIQGASPLGAWWATRTVIQAAVTGDGALAKGWGLDAPGWGERGAMIDAGRFYYPPEFLVEMCSYLSFFKQNVFHVHLSDNLVVESKYSREFQFNLASAFRLWSDDPAVAGLNRHANESYTREQFDLVQTQCAKRGVTVIPEIEAPGHALVIVQWKPELGLDDLSMLNISHPDTIPTMKTIWKTFLPWFHSKVVHIGADEYDSGLIEDYTRFVNEMDTFIREETSGSKQIRIWGTFTPKQGANISTTVSYHHWTTDADHPYWDYVQNGYNVLNSDDYLYLVSGWSPVYAQELQLSQIFDGPYGRPYSPITFDPEKVGDNPSRGNPHVLGQLAALWTDYVFDALHNAVPAQNLDRRIPSKSDTILHYTFDESNSNTVTDHSGNGYHGTVHGCKISDRALHLADGCYLETPLGSKGRDYTLSFRVKPTSTSPGTLFSGPDSIFAHGNGTISNMTLISGGSPFSLNYSLPLNKWTDVSLIAQGNTTKLTVGKGDSSSRMEFLAKIGINGDSFAWASIGVEAPLARVGEGFTGLMKNIVLRGRAE